MMKLIVSIVLALTFLMLPNAQGQQGSGYLASPGIHWDNQRLSGEVRNVPLDSLLEDLMRSEQFDCKVQGTLPGVISMRFDRSTVEESIRRIMRGNLFNYTLILSATGGKDVTEPPMVSELTIYQGNNVVRFWKVPRTLKAPLKSAPAAAPPAPRTAPAVPVPESASVDKQQLDREIRIWMDELLAQKKINREEYDKALIDMGLPQQN